MINSGIHTLGDITITTAGTTTGTAVTSLDGMTAMTVQLRLAYGSGGTAVKAYLQTSLDQATTWLDLACVVFGTASEVAVLNFSGLTPALFSGSPGTLFTPTDGAMADDTALDGILGDRVRVKIVSTGTYGGSTVLSGRIAAR